jgi:hypothetical protein
MFFQASWFFKVVSRHYAFSSIMVSQHCSWALCFLKHFGFSALFVGIVFFHVLWFFSVVCGQCVFFKHYGFSTLFLGIMFFQTPWFFNLVFWHYGYSSIMDFWHCFFSIIFSQARCFLGFTLSLHYVLSFELCL